MVCGWCRNPSYRTGTWNKHRHSYFRVKKTENLIDYINKDYFETHENIRIRIEMDEMWSFYHDKNHQIWLWWAIDHDIGKIIGYWFGTREHKSLDKLKELLSPLDIGTIYVDGNYAYFTRFPNKEIIVTKKNTQKID